MFPGILSHATFTALYHSSSSVSYATGAVSEEEMQASLRPPEPKKSALMSGMKVFGVLALGYDVFLVM